MALFSHTTSSGPSIFSRWIHGGRRYRYESLRAASQDIRLLKLLPGQFGSEIRIELHFAALSKVSPPPYEALSYTWGSMENPVNIIIGNKRERLLSVTQNLSEALQYLRFGDKPRILWIDAICVDQHNLEERSTQVPRMGEIYKLAFRVIVWVGPEENGSSTALRVLQEISSKIKVDWVRGTMSSSPAAEQNGETHWADRETYVPYTVSELLLVARLFDRPWFERLWIRQEVQLANWKAILVCGFNSIPWSTFQKAIFCLQRKKWPFLGDRDKTTAFFDRLEMLSSLCEGLSKQKSMGALIYNTRNCKCADPRDRIYAIPAITDWATWGLKITPDYTKSTAEVYQGVVQGFMGHFKTINILSSCERREQPSLIPSWVPDWSVGRLSRPLRVESGHRASGESAAETAFLGNGILKLAGVKISTIEAATKTILEESFRNDIAEAIRRHAPRGGFSQNDDRLEVYCRTICSDGFPIFDLPRQTGPDLEVAKEAVKICTRKPNESIVGLIAPLKPEHGAYIYRVLGAMKGRSLLTTKGKDSIGLGPGTTRSGDVVVVFLGCDSPMVLRPMVNGGYILVGECFVYGFMRGEALLGPLPEDYEYIQIPHTQGVYYRNRGTDKTTATDPRLSRLALSPEPAKTGDVFESGVKNSRDDFVAAKKAEKFILTSQNLRAAGVDIQTFELI